MITILRVFVSPLEASLAFDDFIKPMDNPEQAKRQEEAIREINHDTMEIIFQKPANMVIKYSWIREYPDLDKDYIDLSDGMSSIEFEGEIDNEVMELIHKKYLKED